MEQKTNGAEDGLILVKGATNTKKLVTCISTATVRRGMLDLRLRGIGAGANNQIAKAIIIAKQKLNAKKIEVGIDMYFKDVDSAKGDGSKVTAIEYLLTFKKL